MVFNTNIDKFSLKLWYKSERKFINYIFNEIMIYLDNREITFTISKQELYNKFVEFLYSFNYLKK